MRYLQTAIQLIISFSLLVASVCAVGQVSYSYVRDGAIFKVEPIIDLQSFQEDEKWTFSGSPVEAEVLKGIQLAENKQYRAAINTFNRLIPSLQNPSRIEFYLGLIYLENGQLPLAIHYMQQSLAHEPILMECRYYLGLAYLKMNQKEKARQHFASLDNIEGYSYLGVAGFGMIALSEEDEKAAEKLFKQSIEINTRFLPAIEELCKLKLGQEKPRKAKEWIQVGLEIDPQWKSGQLFFVICELQAKAPSFNSLKLLNQLLEEDAESIQYLFLRAHYFVVTKDIRNAIAAFTPAFRQLVQLRDTEINTESRNQIETMTLALMYYNEHLPTDPGILELMDKAIYSFVTGDGKRTLNLLNQLRELNFGGNAMILTIYGIALKNLGKDAAAIDILGEAILSDSSNWAAHLIRGELFYKYDYADYADQDCAIAQYLRPQVKEVYMIRARLQYEDRQYKSAYKTLTKALAIDDAYVSVLNLRGSASSKMKAYQEATLDFKQITSIDPFNSNAYLKLHECYLQMSDTSTAIHYLDTASMYSVNSDENHYKLIKMAKTQNSSENVKNGYQRLVNYHPNDIENVLDRGKYYYDTGAFHMAISDFERGIQLSKSSESTAFLEELDRWLQKSHHAIEQERISE